LLPGRPIRSPPIPTCPKQLDPRFRGLSWGTQAGELLGHEAVFGRRCLASLPPSQLALDSSARGWACSDRSPERRAGMRAGRAARGAVRAQPAVGPDHALPGLAAYPAHAVAGGAGRRVPRRAGHGRVPGGHAGAAAGRPWQHSLRRWQLVRSVSWLLPGMK